MKAARKRPRYTWITGLQWCMGRRPANLSIVRKIYNWDIAQVVRK